MVYKEALQHVREAIEWRSFKEEPYCGEVKELITGLRCIDRRREWFPLHDSNQQVRIKRYYVQRYVFDVTFFRTSFRDDTFTYTKPIIEYLKGLVIFIGESTWYHSKNNGLVENTDVKKQEKY